ncbi:MAG: HTTM domain-containing protein [Aureispira sp.]|nr:HTTM domain-containing protein [Aureispira sp.]
MEVKAVTTKEKINLREHLFEQIPASSLGLFRIAWGLVMFYFFGRLCLWTEMGRVKYVEPIFHFKYPGFEWVEVLPPGMMYALIYLGVILSILVGLGLFYRFASIALAVVYIYTFLLDVTYWNNHYYAYGLFALFFTVVDAHQAFSIDKWRLNLAGMIPKWQLYLFRFQFFVIYFYGGLSKLQNKDWLDNVSGYALVENSFFRRGWATQHHLIYPFSLVITWGGLVFDLLIGWLLLWRRTLWLSLFLVIGFNVPNAIFLTIGSFPYTMLASFILFVPPFALDAFLNKRLGLQKKGVKANTTIRKTYKITQRLILLGLTMFVCFQLLFPFRSLFYDGSVFWTKEGKLCSWHMMSGSSYVSVDFDVVEVQKGTNLEISSSDLDPKNFLSNKQIQTLGKWPFLIPQFARFLKKEAEYAGFENVKIYGRILVSRNKRPLIHIVPPDIDLASLKMKKIGHNEWILRYPDEDGFFK